MTKTTTTTTEVAIKGQWQASGNHGQVAMALQWQSNGNGKQVAMALDGNQVAVAVK